jgi:hypothetical protein
MFGVEPPNMSDTHEYRFGWQCCIRIKSRMYTVYKGKNLRRFIRIL